MGPGFGWCIKLFTTELELINSVHLGFIYKSIHNKLYQINKFKKYWNLNDTSKSIISKYFEYWF